MATDGGEGGGQVVDLVDRLDPRRRRAAMHAGGQEGALDLPAVRDPARTEGRRCRTFGPARCLRRRG
jgi:hypothetical protein